MKSVIIFIALLSIISLTKAATKFGYNNRKIPPQNSILTPQRIPSDTIKTIIRNDHMGNYVYGFETSDGIVQRQAGEANGSKRGYYSYVDPDGRTYTVCYIADEHGYRIVGDPKLGAIKEIQCPYDKDKRRPNPLAKSGNAGIGYGYVKPLPVQVKRSGYGYENPSPLSLPLRSSNHQAKSINYPVPDVDPFVPPYV